MGALSPLDPSSYSRPEKAVVRHVSLRLNVDFEKHVLNGQATLDFDVQEDVNDLILDVSNLTIESIVAEDGSKLQYKLGEHVANLGSKLTILLPKQLAAGENSQSQSTCDSKINTPSVKPCPKCNGDHYLDNCSQFLGISNEKRLELIPQFKLEEVGHKSSYSEEERMCEEHFVKNTSRLDDGRFCVRIPVKQSAEVLGNSVERAKHCLFSLERRFKSQPTFNNRKDEIASSSEEFPNELCKSVCDKYTSAHEDIPLVFNGYMYQITSLDSSEGTTVSSVGSASTGDRCCGRVMRLADYDGYRLTVKIKYSTSPEASALQWLEPEQTSGKKHPYMFSQCQPIHARSILPCQDTPAVKFTYDAEVTAPEEFTVLMSALRGEARSNKTTFRQPMPLPSYLVAIAVGVLESRSLGPRSTVWSEKEEIERSAWEFAETEKYLQAAEKLCGPYEWTQYDLLVLPPSFPYGGMENPCLTFVTPTLLAGDRSQADVIVHEIMHSWTGNLVTNRNFEHFWLNEGFTVFLERKVAASLISDPAEAKKSRDFNSLLGLQELSEAIDVFGSSSPLTNLVVDLNGIHPDDAFSRVPYEKGSLFLRYLEDLAGGPEVFDDFLRSYLTKFRKKSLDTDQFKDYLLEYFKDSDALKNVDWDAWLYKSGMPPIIPDYDTTMTKAISALVVKIADPNATISHEDVATFTPHQMIHLLQLLIDRPALPLETLTAIGKEYKISGNKNSEILYRWLRLCVRSRDQAKLSDVFNFVNSQGRMKYVRPLYRDLYAWEDVREQAIENFLKNEKYMMHISAYTVKKDLHLDEKTKE